MESSRARATKAARARTLARSAQEERANAWWSGVELGVDAPHPRHGDLVRVSIDGDVVRVSATVETAAERDELLREARSALAGRGKRIRADIDVRAQPPARQEPLSQTLVAVYPSSERAGSAAGLLEGHTRVTRRNIELGLSTGQADALAQRVGTDATWLRELMTNGRALLLVTVQEPDAFVVRQVLDEETDSLATHVLPPR
jgi:hypothetical protein